MAILRRSRRSAAKRKKKPAKKKATKPSKAFSTPLTTKSKKHAPRGKNPNLHAASCTVCNHKDRLEIENLYIRGSSVNALSRQFGVTLNALYRHGDATGLRGERDERTITRVDQLLKSWIGKKNLRIQSGSVVSLLELRAKLSGEMAEKPTERKVLEVEFQEGVTRQVGRMLKNIPGLSDYVGDKSGK